MGKLLNIPYIGVDNFDCGYQVATTALAEWNSRRTKSPEKIATVWDDRHRCSPSYNREAGVAIAMAALGLIPTPATVHGCVRGYTWAERESIARAVSAAGAAHPDILICGASHMLPLLSKRTELSRGMFLALCDKIRARGRLSAGELQPSGSGSPRGERFRALRRDFDRADLHESDWAQVSVSSATSDYLSRVFTRYARADVPATDYPRVRDCNFRAHPDIKVVRGK